MIADSPVRIDWSVALARHQRWLRTVILARLGEPQAVEDVFQEVALAAVARGPAAVEPSRVAAWLHRLAVRQTLLFRRKAGRQRKLVDRYAGRGAIRTAEDEAVDPLGWLVAAERKQLVHEALACLPPRDAEVLLLKYSENWSYRALAEHLGQSESAIEARLHRARRRLREALASRSAFEVGS